jgi:hydroxymethylbilane synthase
MPSPLNAARVGTRGSPLARAQTALAAAALTQAHPVLTVSEHLIRTLGDRVTDTPLAAMASGASGVFTSALEEALARGEIDIAVHSAKDLPIRSTPGLTLAAFLPRADVRDALISQAGWTLATLPPGAIIGTSSPRRAAQLLAIRPDLIMRDLRGNIDTRLARAHDPQGGYAAIVLACAGLERLKRADMITETLALEVMLPAPAQGAIALQVRDEPLWVALVRAISDAPTERAVHAERAFLRGLGGGCALPVAAYGRSDANGLMLRGRVLTRDGTSVVDVRARFALEAADAAGEGLAKLALARGAARLIALGQP